MVENNSINPPTRQYTILEKRDFLQALGTSQVIKDLFAAEINLEKVLRDISKLRSESSDYLAGRSDDCRAVRQIEAELAVSIPETSESNKKLTETDKKAWLARQRKENKELAAAIEKQKMADFSLADLSIQEEITRTKLNDLRSVLALRTAQISFFAGDVRLIIQQDPEIEEQKTNIQQGGES